MAPTAVTSGFPGNHIDHLVNDQLHHPHGHCDDYGKDRARSLI
jgi:hypothetical protein